MSLKPKPEVSTLKEMFDISARNATSATLVSRFEPRIVFTNILILQSSQSRIQVSQNASQGVRQRPRMPDVPAEVQAEANVHCAHEEEARNRIRRPEALPVPAAKLTSPLGIRSHAYEVYTQYTRTSKDKTIIALDLFHLNMLHLHLQAH